MFGSVTKRGNRKSSESVGIDFVLDGINYIDDLDVRQNGCGEKKPGFPLEILSEEIENHYWRT